MTRRGDWFQTYSGIQFYPGDPHPNDILIVDIAHALSNVCRFAGHTRDFYSVAQHSVLVSRTVPAEHRLWGLLHDAAEAYVHDITRPMKQLPEMQAYRDIEQRVMVAICERYHLTMPEPPCVKEADNRVLMTERRDLLTIHRDWSWHAEPLEGVIVPLAPFHAKRLFLEEFYEAAANRLVTGRMSG